MNWELREMVVSEEEISIWKKTGWSFRIKKVGKNKYITRRKNNKERSLGKYNDVLWMKIKDTKPKESKMSQIKKSEDLISFIVGELRADEKVKSCKYISEGFCYFWLFDEKPGFFNTADNQLYKGLYKKIKKRSEGKVKEKWVFKAIYFYCRECSSYQR